MSHFNTNITTNPHKLTIGVSLFTNLRFKPAKLKSWQKTILQESTASHCPRCMANINNIAVSTFNTFLFVHFRWLVPLVEQCVSDKAKLHGFTDKRPAVYGLILQGHYYYNTVQSMQSIVDFSNNATCRERSVIAGKVQVKITEWRCTTEHRYVRVGLHDAVLSELNLLPATYFRTSLEYYCSLQQNSMGSMLNFEVSTRQQLTSWLFQ